ncbi:MAG: DASH family cryptochrome [Rhodothermales bacterium]
MLVYQRMPLIHMILVWFRNDLRIADHEALARAVATGQRILPVYCIDPRHFGRTRWGTQKTGVHRVRFVLESLSDLRHSLRRLGSDVVIRQGHPEDIIPGLAETYGVTALHVHEEITQEEDDEQRAVEAAMATLDVEVAYSWGHTLVHRDDLPMPSDAIPKVFTPFRKRVEQGGLTVRDLFPAPTSLPALPDTLVPGNLPSLTDLGVDSPATDERAVLPFRGGEQAAWERVNTYIWEHDELKRYKETRNGLLGADYSSKFSAWLAAGCISPRALYQEVKRYEHERVKNNSTYWLVFELLWRDFFRFIGLRYGDRLFYRSGPMNRSFWWRHDDADFERWASGQTGIPFIDANMRELNATGFMSNRGRQNVASFFAKSLNLEWRRGAAYFEQQLVDYDVTSNWGNWAYAAGVGNDPRDRYFNIVGQAQRYDPDGAYVKTWVPELAKIPAGQIHEPHKLSPMEQQMYSITIGQDYPAPMIDLDASYRRLREGG